ncbi:MAG: hypothetical protein CMB72_02060 [Euryarchaeota archaeon]|nr:hypothetical protein [Euryarchaeota archaeon]
MARRIRLASASSRRLNWLTEHLNGLAKIDAKPLVGEEKKTDGEVSIQVTQVLEDKISRARLQFYLESQTSEERDTLPPPGLWVVSDTLVEDPNDVNSALGQPENEISALRMLLDLSGRRHLVWSGTAIIDFTKPEPIINRYIESAVVEFQSLDESVLSLLISSGSWRGKAGAYDMAGKAEEFTQLVEGEKVTVLGFASQAIEEIRSIFSHSDSNS